MIPPPDMVEGYYDGLRDDRREYPSETNRGRAYAHGWRNGRDDRLKSPRAPASTLRDEAKAAAEEDAKS